MCAAEARSPVPQGERKQTIQAMLLALTAGYVDGFGLLLLGTYVSFMSGNTTMAGVRVGQGDLSLAVTPAIAVAFFLAGSVVGNLVAHSGLPYARRLLAGLVAALLTLALLLPNLGTFTYEMVAVLSLGMGMVNPALPQIGSESVSLTFVTGTLSRIGSHLALALRKSPVYASQGPWDTHLYRARIGVQLWTAFVCGAVFSGIVLSFGSSFALVPAIAIMLALALTSYAQAPAH